MQIYKNKKVHGLVVVYYLIKLHIDISVSKSLLLNKKRLNDRKSN